MYSYYVEDLDAYMHNMINGGGFIMDGGLGTEQDTQGEGYNIDEKPFFRRYGNTMVEDTIMDDEAGIKGDNNMDGADA
jgi:hypothetical protein